MRPLALAQAYETKKRLGEDLDTLHSLHVSTTQRGAQDCKIIGRRLRMTPSLSSSLGRRHVNMLAKRFILYLYRDKERIFDQGDVGDMFYIVQDGSCSVTQAQAGRQNEVAVRWDDAGYCAGCVYVVGVKGVIAASYSIAYTLEAARSDMIGVSMTNAGASVAPLWGRRRMLGMSVGPPRSPLVT